MLGKWSKWGWCFCLAWLLALPVSGFTEDKKLTVYESELTQLIQLSLELKDFNGKLSKELASSLTNSSKLAADLETWKLKAENLALELDQQLQASGKSLIALADLKSLLQKARTELTNLETSWTEYKKETQTLIQQKETEGWINAAIAATLGLLAGLGIGALF